jgi:hypothetical protein
MASTAHSGGPLQETVTAARSPQALHEPWSPSVSDALKPRSSANSDPWSRKRRCRISAENIDRQDQQVPNKQREVKADECFAATFRFHYQDGKNHQVRNVSWLLVTVNIVPSSLILSVLMMEAIGSFETSVHILTTLRYNQEDGKEIQ